MGGQPSFSCGNLCSLVHRFGETVFLPSFNQNNYIDAFPTYFVVNILVISLGIIIIIVIIIIIIIIIIIYFVFQRFTRVDIELVNRLQ